MLTKKKRAVKQDVQSELRAVLSKQKSACYILITCQEPSIDGKMHVEMTYEGDTDLAAYLLNSAQNFFD